MQLPWYPACIFAGEHKFQFFIMVNRGQFPDFKSVSI